MKKFKLTRSSIVKGIFIGLALVLLIHLGLYIYNAAKVLPSDLTLGYGEGYHVWLGQQYMEDIPPYHPLTEPPAIALGYAPIYHMLTGFIGSIFGYELWVGRTVSFVSALLTGLFIFLIVKRITKSKSAGAIGGLIFFLPPIIKYWSLLYRVDTLALMFTLAGIYLALRFDDRRRLLWSVPLFVLAFYTKQSFIAAPLAIGLYLLIKDRKLFLQFASLGIISGLTILGVGSLLTQGEFFHHLVLLSGGMPMYFSNITLLYGTFIKEHIFLLLPAMVMVGLHFKSRKWGILDLYLPIVALTLLGIAKEGSWYNYGIELIALCSILIGCLVPYLYKSMMDVKFPVRLKVPEGLLLKGGSSSQVFCAGFISAFLVIVLIFQSGNTSSYQAILFHPNPQETTRVQMEVRELIKSVPGKVICENSYLLVKEDKEILWEPSALVQYAKMGSWDQTWFVNTIVNQDYDLIILDWTLDWYFSGPPEGYGLPERYWIANQRCTDEIANVINSRYFLYGTYGDTDFSRMQEGEAYYVYAPKIGGN